MVVLAALLFGVVIGSFINVIVLRLGTGRSLGGRSLCLSCGHQLNACDLIPILSFLIQRGRCRYCTTKISPQYLLVELFTAVLFGLTAYRHLPILIYPITALLVAMVAYDIKHKIIPDVFVYPFIILTLFASSFAKANLISGVALFVIFGGLWLVSGGKWMGFGDAKLVLGIGLLLGPNLSFMGMLIAFWSGAIVGIAMLYLSRGSLTIKSEIPFAPFLIFGMFVALFANIPIHYIVNFF